jgi:hypothetical protein
MRGRGGALQLLVVGLQPAAGDQGAQVAALVPEVAASDDAQEECLRLVVDSVPGLAPAKGTCRSGSLEPLDHEALMSY